MKKFFLMLPASIALTVTAQSNTTSATNLAAGTVVYERVMKLDVPFSGPDGEPMTNMPRQLTERYELLFSGRQSLWQTLPDAAAEAAAASGNSMDLMRPTRLDGGDADVVYQDFSQDTRLTQSELRSKTYLVTDSIAAIDWKLSEDTKEILGYKTRKATAYKYGTRTIMGMENGVLKSQDLPDTSMIVAWFAEGIPVPAGPEYNSGLPGLILELDENGGRSVFYAVSVSPKLAAGRLKVPKRGKQISVTAFRAEQQKWMAEMQQRMQQGGRVAMPFRN
jgi:GLPGLI family protein